MDSTFHIAARRLPTLLVLALAACTAPDPVPHDATEPAPPPHRVADGVVDHPSLRAIVELQTARDTFALVTLLADADPAVRARAAFALGSVRAPVAGPALVALLSDPNARVREDAAFALGQLDAVEMVPADPGVDIERPAAGADRALADRLAVETDPRVRAALIEALGKVAREEVAAGMVSAAPADEERADWNLALSRIAIRGVGGDAVFARLADDFEHADPEVRKMAVYAFIRATGIPEWPEYRRRAREALEGMEWDDPSAFAFVRAVGRQFDVFARVVLERWALSAKDWKAREAAAASLGEMKGPTTWDVLFAALEDPSEHVRLAAAGSMTTEPWGPGVIAAARAHLRARPDDYATDLLLLRHFAQLGEREPVLEWMEGHDWSDLDRSRTAVGVAAAFAGEEGVRWLWEAVASSDGGIRQTAFSELVSRWDLSRTRPASYATFLEGFEVILRGPDDRSSARAATLLADSVLLAEGSGAVLRDYWVRLDAEEEPLRARAVLAALGEDPDPASEAVLREAAMASPAVARVAIEVLNARTGENTPLPDEEPGPTSTRGPAYASPDWDRIRSLGAHPRLVLETERGRVVLELATEEAPVTVQEITRLAEEGRYDGTPFHRVVSNFVVQGGDVSAGNGTGGPGYRMRSELTRIPYARGVLGMARQTAYDTEGSQFFVTHSFQPHLTGAYGAFGRLIEGMDVVDHIMQGDLLLHAEVIPDGAPSGH